jgi:IclR family acetate operon transcriptional repressor
VREELQPGRTAPTGIAKPTILRLLGELAEWSAVERTPHGFRLGMRMFELGQLTPSQHELREAGPRS